MKGEELWDLVMRSPGVPPECYEMYWTSQQGSGPTPKNVLNLSFGDERDAR